jgi:hypothetical protein
MHSTFSTRGAQRRSIVRNTIRSREPSCIMQLTVDAAAVTSLRQLVVRMCGAAFEYMRIDPSADVGKVKVWLCLSQPVAARVAAAVLRCLPATEFGPVFNTATKVSQ